MKTVGKIIKETRLRKKISLAKLEDKTKIKKDFLQAIEEENWSVLPDLPVVTGFVKNLAAFLGINESHLTAMLRRDYPPKTLSINPKPDVAERFIWTPRLTFYLGAGIVGILILSYLVFQYAKFVSPPVLSVSRPPEAAEVITNKVRVEGITDPNATVKVNNQPVLVGEDGTFSVDIEIYAGTREIIIKSTSRTGKETTVRRTINPKL